MPAGPFVRAPRRVLHLALQHVLVPPLVRRQHVPLVPVPPFERHGRRRMRDLPKCNVVLRHLFPVPAACALRICFAARLWSS